ncbi:DNA polymerase IV [Nocardioides terrisoli]|uniref:DNA polymerase IV n=1 Tax=Nocardioides terrisoli TaxID=3388267 RepID=UPI00287B82C2|nr:DNA polymerase IV [Nocardioides marmorisolisilvae]
MNGAATILHADLDSFYASVEQRDDPGLRGRPVLVGAGVVLAASYEAKARGVHTPMPCREALELCPDAVVVSPRMSAYLEASRAVFAVFDDTTPLVDPVSVDEAFLEVGGLRRIAGDPVEIGRRLRSDVRRRVGLPITVGIARTKFLAKVASGVGKPDGLLLVEPDRERQFLDPLPVGRLWGVGPVTEAALLRRGLVTVGNVRALPEGALVAMLGQAGGRHLHALAHNRDPRPVEVGRRRHSIGSQCALGTRPRPAEEIDARLAGLVDRVTRRMRTAHRAGRTVTLRLRFGDFTRATRSHTLAVPTARTSLVLEVARTLLHRESAQVRQRGLTLIGIAVGNLQDAVAEQPMLPLARRDVDGLDAALDGLRDRYGAGAVTRASLIGRDQGLTVPLLPD